MRELLVIDKSVALTRVAKISDNKLKTLFVDNHFEQSRQDKIYIGQVIDIVKSLQAAFVDIGTDKKAMLHFKHIPENERNNLKIGTRIAVQVTKEQMGDKGDRLSAFINITGSYAVCLVNETGIAVSKKINDNRDYFKELVQTISQNKFGFIIRTNAQYVSEEVLIKELNYLIQKATELENTKQVLAKGSIFKTEQITYGKWLLQQKLESNELDILCNDEVELNNICNFIQTFMSHIKTTNKLYPVNEALFITVGIEKIFKECLKPKVWLKNGGNIVIEHTEAMTIIDVNSAKAVVKKDVFPLNKFAIEEALLQCIKRNICGIIIIDLVETENSNDKVVLYEYAKELIEQHDPKRMKVYKITDIGLLQLTRTRVNRPLHECLLESVYQLGLKQTKYQMAHIIFQIEEKLRQISQPSIKITFAQQFYGFVTKNNIVNKLEETYKININVEYSNDLTTLYFKLSS
ncbi:MAG: hypothetical protein BEN18_03000 [Epulopiscium sp. Nuni2H_MBin001]|nr:MAG: hypothetical protein BEN18_03000 [Epulopiscium sp. Nuni2H_MBin001]